MQNKKAVCVIAKDYDKNWVSFLNTFDQYDVYFIVDNNLTQYSKYSNVEVVQITNEKCDEEGFKHLVDMIERFNKISGWDKAVYYFAKIKTSYEYVWFLETDVFLESQNTLRLIDEQCLEIDFLAFDISEAKKEPHEQFPNYWWWPKIYKKHSTLCELFFYSSLCCHTRMSFKFLSKIKEYAENHKTLYFLEAFFPSLCVKNNLTHKDLKEFNAITKPIYNRPGIELDSKIKNLMFTTHKNVLFHPIKNTNEHKERRMWLAIK